MLLGGLKPPTHIFLLGYIMNHPPTPKKKDQSTKAPTQTISSISSQRPAQAFVHDEAALGHLRGAVAFAPTRGRQRVSECRLQEEKAAVGGLGGLGMNIFGVHFQVIGTPGRQNISEAWSAMKSRELRTVTISLGIEMQVDATSVATLEKRTAKPTIDSHWTMWTPKK